MSTILAPHGGLPRRARRLDYTAIHDVRRDPATGGVFVKRTRGRTRDSFMTFDAATRDSTGAFLVGVLERLDPTLNMPLVGITWSRDIDLREDVSIGDEASSFTNSSFASPGGINPTGKSWAGKRTTAITGISVDIGKTPQPLTLWAMELDYTIVELESAIKVGRPIDEQKLAGINLKFQMDVDEMVYVGDAALGQPGLLNLASVTPANAPNGALGSPLWANKTPDEILKDVNSILNQAWVQSGYAVVPGELRLPPSVFSFLVMQKVSAAGNISTLEYLKANTISNSANGQPLNIQPLKWLVGAGAGTTNRVLAYTKDKSRVRFPLVPLQRTPVEARGLFQVTTYFGKLGVVEAPYAETIAYLDGV